MTSSLALLQDYARNHVQASFTALVNRHLDLVYSAALRQVRSAQLAEEVAQSVFTDLARNAGKLGPDTILTAWLYQVARRTAIDVVRRESRRQLRERVASEVNAMNATADDWSHIEPLLDDAMEALDQADRAAVLLRFFENKSLREVGEQLGVSDDAAQKRVSRAVNRLREFFAKRQVRVGATGLVALISANAVQAAPAALATTVSTATVAGTVLTTTIAAQAATSTLNWISVKTICVAMAAAIASGAGMYLVKHNEVKQLREENQSLTTAQRELVEKRDPALAVAAANIDELERWQSERQELLRLRGEVTDLRNQVARFNREAEETAQQGSGTNTGQDVLDAFMMRAQAELVKRAAQEASNKVASLKPVLELTPWQEESIRDALNRVAQLNELNNGTLTLGGYTGSELLEMSAWPKLETYLITNGLSAAQAAEKSKEISQMDGDLQVLLSPSQRLLYEQHKIDHAKTRAHQISSGVALKLTEPLALTTEQQEKVASAVYDLWIAPPAIPQSSGSSEWLRDLTLNALEGVLSPAQLAKARKLEDEAPQ